METIKIKNEMINKKEDIESTIKSFLLRGGVGRKKAGTEECKKEIENLFAKLLEGIDDKRADIDLEGVWQAIFWDDGREVCKKLKAKGMKSVNWTQISWFAARRVYLSVFGDLV